MTIHTGIVAVAEWYNFRIPTVVVTGLGKLAQELEDLGRGGTIPLVVHPEGLSYLFLAPAQRTGLAPPVGNRFVV